MPGLAPRRYEVVNYLANGYTVREIAKLMYLSTRSVYGYIGAGHRLYGTRTMPELVAKAVDSGIVEFE